jgi:hypothetical protein
MVLAVGRSISVSVVSVFVWLPYCTFAVVHVCSALSATLPGEVLLLATGIWPVTGRKVPRLSDHWHLRRHRSIGVFINPCRPSKRC